jgi:hypothetical protein
VSDPEGAAYARLTAVRARLDQPSAKPLEGQQAIDLEDTQPRQDAVTQPALW